MFSTGGSTLSVEKIWPVETRAWDGMMMCVERVRYKLSTFVIGPQSTFRRRFNTAQLADLQASVIGISAQSDSCGSCQTATEP
jgi:hypothetical protein